MSEAPIDETFIRNCLRRAPEHFFAVMFDRDTKLGHFVLGYTTQCKRRVGTLNLGAVPHIGEGFVLCPECEASVPVQQLTLFEVES